MNSDLQAYLSNHPEVGDAIIWDGIPCRDWPLNTATQDFYARLDTFYTSLAAGGPLQLSFAPAIVPPLSGSYMTPQDASEVFLAHVAHSLWLEISQGVSWRLHDYDCQLLPLLFDSRNMFANGTAAVNALGFYAPNCSVAGTATPGSPIPSYQFLTGTNCSIRTGPSFIKSTVRDTIWEVFRWIRDHLRHGSSLSAAQAQAVFGCSGYQPVQKIFTRTTDPNWTAGGARFISYMGCHSTAGLVVWVLRTANIPVRSWPTFIEDSQQGLHAGIDLPSQYLFHAHTDNFYAMPQTLDPSIEPWELFGAPKSFAVKHVRRPSFLSDLARHHTFEVAGALTPAQVKSLRIYMVMRKYYDLKTKYLSAPPAGSNRAKEYRKAEATKGLAHPTHFFVDQYWASAIYHTTAFSYSLQTEGFDPSEIANITAQTSAKMDAIIAAFKKLNPGLSDDACLAAYNAAYQAWSDAR